MRDKDYNGFTPDPDEPEPGADESARVLAGLIAALEDARRWARDALAKLSRGPREAGESHEDRFAEAIARTLRGEE